MTLPENQRHALMHVAGVRLAGNTLVAVHAAGTTVWCEAQKSKRLWRVIAKGRRLMNSAVQPLLDEGYLRTVPDGSSLLLEQTDKRP